MKTRITLFTILSVAVFCASTNIRGSWRTHIGSSAPAVRSSRQGRSVTRRNWEYLVEDAYNASTQAGWELVWVSRYYYLKRPSIAPSKGGPTWQLSSEDAWNDPAHAQRVLNERGGEGWEFVGIAGNSYFFKRVASQGRPTWEYLVENAWNDPGRGQNVLNQRGGEGWEFVERSGDYYYLKRAGIATSKGRQTWEYLIEGAYNDPDRGQSVLNQRGGEGWEFVETDGSYYYLKRASIASTTKREPEEDGRTPAARPSRREQITLEYKVYYLCNGERVMVTRCRKDSDQPGFPPTQPNQDYCQVIYPDRPKRGGFEAMGQELRGDLIKKLQECTR